MRQKYIFLDVDGTLFDPELRRIPDSAMEAITKAKENGHKIFICTGRSYSEVSEFRNMAFELEGFICSSGAVVEINKSIVYENFISGEDIEYIIELVESKSAGYILEGSECLFLDPISYSHFAGYFEKDFGNDKDIIYKKMNERKFYTIAEYDKRKHNVCKVSVYAEKTDAAETVKEIRAGLPEKFNLVEVVTYDNEEHIFAEINMRGISKATGLDIVLNHFKADVTDTISYGDSMNDMEMLQHSHIGVCMGNGVEELKKVADDITASYDQNGIYLSFKKYGLI